MHLKSYEILFSSDISSGKGVFPRKAGNEFVHFCQVPVFNGGKMVPGIFISVLHVRSVHGLPLQISRALRIIMS